MARIRTIKPEFFTSEDTVALSPLARLLYIALWCEADKEGRLQWRPNTFKLRYLPGDTCDVQALCAELLARGMVRLYGDGLAELPTFRLHQHINPREADSKLPPPSGDDFDAPMRGESRAPFEANEDGDGPAPVDDALARVVDASARVLHAQVGRERKGKERNSPTDVGERARGAQPTPDPAESASAKPARRHAAPPRPPDVDEQTWADWLALRRSKSAAVTATVLAGARAEAGLAGMPLAEFLREWCLRGSQGLKAAWLKRGGGAQPRDAPAQSFAAQDRDAAMARWEAMTGCVHPDRAPRGASDAPGVIDVTPKTLSVETAR